MAQSASVQLPGPNDGTHETDLARLVSGLPGIVYRCRNDVDSTMLFISDGVQEITGYPASDFLGNKRRSIRALIHPCDGNGFRRAVDQALVERRPYAVEYRIKTADGRHRRVFERGRAVNGIAGEPLHLEGTILDVTERTETEERYRSLFETSRDGIVFVDLEGRIEEANPSYLQMLGYSMEELNSLTYQRITPDAWAALEADVVDNQVMKRGYSDVYEKEYVRRDGSKLPIQIRVWLVRDESDRPVRLMALVRDITELKQREEALGKSEARFRAIFENAPLGITLAGEDRKYVVVNAAFEQMTGYRADELIGRSFVDITHPENRDEQLALNDRLDAGEISSFSLEKRYLRKDGETLWAHVRVASIEQESGAPRLSVGMMRDVNREKLAEAKREQAERARRESEARLAEAQAIAHVGHWSMVTATRALTWSDEVYRIFGVDKENFDHTFDAYLERIHPEDIERVRETITAGKALGEPFDYEHRIVLPDGRVRIAHERALPWRDDRGVLIGWRGTIQDITSLKRAEAALKESERQLRLVTDAMPAALAHIDASECYLYANKALGEFYGVSPNEIIGRKVEEVASRSAYEALGPYRKAAWSGKVSRFESVDVETHRGRRTMRGCLVPQLDDDGDVKGLFAFFQDITDLKETEKAYQRSEEKNRRLSEAQRIAHVGSWEYDFTTDGLAWSDETFRIFGMKRREIALTSATFYERVHPEDRAYVRQHVKQSAGRGGHYSCEHRIVLPTGEIRHVEELGEIFGNSMGQPILGIGTVQDITERKTEEIALRSSARHAAKARDYLFKALEHMDDGFAIYDWDSRLVVCNERYREINEMIRDLLVPGEKFETCVRAAAERGLYARTIDDVEVVVSDRLARFREHGLSVEQQCDGRWIERRDLPTGDGGTICFRSDVTERLQAEQSLRQSEERLRLITENVPALVAYFDSGRRYRFVNDIFEQWFGKPAASVIGQTLEEGIGTENYARVRDHVDAVLAGERVTYHPTVLSHDGTELQLSTSLVPDFGDDGEVRGFYALVSDMTQYNKIEAQLRQAQKMEAMGQLTGGVAHDFNNLLLVIMGHLEILLSSMDADDTRCGYLRKAILATERGADLTQRLLAFSRRQTLKPRPTNPNELVTNMTDMVSHVLAGTVEVETRLASNAYAAMVDAHQLETSILNLVVNARDAMPNGGTIGIATRNVNLDAATARRHDVNPGGYVLIEVSDTGTGISAHLMDRVIEPFFTTKQPGQGTGLGLSMVYGFVKQSGGFLRIDSRAGQGTMVGLYFPRAQFEATEAEEQATRGLAPSDSHKILVVEDDADVREAAVALLSGLGHVPLEAADAKHARWVLKNNPDIEMMLTDIALPGGTNGIGLAQEALRLRPDLKVLYMSGLRRESAAFRALAGDELFLQKPFHRHTLEAALQEVWSRSPMAQAG